MRWSRMFVLVIASTAACASRETVAIAPGEYQLQGVLAWYANAVTYAPAALTRRALTHCPSGFERTQEWFDVVGGENVLVWNIRCRT